MLLLYAQQVFRKVVNKNKIQEIKNSWALISDTKEQEFKDINTKYEYFKTHNTKYLQNLVRNNVTTKQTGAQAHVVEEQGIMIADLQGTMQSVIDNQNQLQDQYIAQAKAGYNANIYNAPWSQQP
uniref:Uncharacterized protein n=1 Tax=Pseudo-nitzschia australis TaxID=44445 RepID=A0A7S4AMB9_9STRA